MTVSMTGFATAKGQGAGHVWGWDLRSVNGKGLDLRLRVPDWIDGLEQAVRADLGRAVQRGNVSLSLRVSRDAGEGTDTLRINPQALAGVLRGLAQVEEAAMSAGVTLAQATAADVLLVRGVLDASQQEEDLTPLRTAILADLPALIAAFNAMRASEGAALQAVIAAQLDRIAALGAPVFNSPATVRWNIRKTYLREFEAKGVPIIPTRWAEQPVAADIRAAMVRSGQGAMPAFKPTECR